MQPCHKTRVNPHTSCHHSVFKLSLQGSRPLNLSHPEAGAAPSSKKQARRNIHRHSCGVFSLRCDKKLKKEEECPVCVAEPRHHRGQRRCTSQKEILMLSLTLSHSFVPFQQFVSDNQKLDNHGDMSGIC